MKRPKLISIAVMAITVGIATQTQAWDSYGHMEVACVAYQQLSPQIKLRVHDLLALNPSNSTWSSWVPAGTSAADKDMMIFMMAATWPDEIKSDPSYIADGSQNGNRPDGSPDPTANTGYTDKFMHKYWHFIDMPFSQDGTPLPPIPTPNAQERITLFRSVLASSSADDLKSYDLSWLLHLVGDVHQPLHCSTRVSSSSPAGDSGGNDVALTGSPNELHAFWDDLLGTGSDKSKVKAVIKAANKLPAPDATLAAKSDAKDWVMESFQAAQDSVYVSPIGAGNGPFTLTAVYKANSKALAEERIALAGARLANLLNNELK
jgi:S1/P1 Nuclease